MRSCTCHRLRSAACASRLRESLSRRRHFLRLASAEINAVKRLLRSEGLGALARSLTTAVGWDKLEQSLKPHDPMLCFYIRQHRGLWQLARADQTARAVTRAAATALQPAAQGFERDAGTDVEVPFRALQFCLARFRCAVCLPTDWSLLPQ